MSCPKSRDKYNHIDWNKSKLLFNRKKKDLPLFSDFQWNMNYFLQLRKQTKKQHGQFWGPSRHLQNLLFKRNILHAAVLWGIAFITRPACVQALAWAFLGLSRQDIFSDYPSNIQWQYEN